MQRQHVWKHVELNLSIWIRHFVLIRLKDNLWVSEFIFLGNYRVELHGSCGDRRRVGVEGALMGVPLVLNVEFKSQPLQIKLTFAKSLNLLLNNQQFWFRPIQCPFHWKGNTSCVQMQMFTDFNHIKESKNNVNAYRQYFLVLLPQKQKQKREKKASCAGNEQSCPNGLPPLWVDFFQKVIIFFWTIKRLIFHSLPEKVYEFGKDSWASTWPVSVSQNESVSSQLGCHSSPTHPPGPGASQHTAKSLNSIWLRIQAKKNLAKLSANIFVRLCQFWTVVVTIDWLLPRDFFFVISFSSVIPPKPSVHSSQLSCLT